MSSTPPPAPPETWNRARSVAKALVNPVQRFLAVEAAGGLLLLGAVVLALAWANSPWANTYEAAWRTPIGFRIGSLEIEHSLHFWINEGLMTVFFFVVGLEIRREMHEGELSDFKRAALPLVAALGGVVVPALIYLALNAGRAGAGGWAIPMADFIYTEGKLLEALGSPLIYGNRANLNPPGTAAGLARVDPAPGGVNTLCMDEEFEGTFPHGKYGAGDVEFEIFPLTKKRGAAFPDRITIGRTSNNDIVLNDTSVSRLHAYVKHTSDRWLVADAGSKNGSTLRGAPLEPRREQALPSRAQLKIGDVDLTFYTAVDLYAALGGNA